ncbi:ESPR-type extended signal peptide-containing protein [Acinetobacter nosocomialis]|uniref:ESPR-type extended signal peptide-containing protein n=1 Tax=Acinetobacter nosocomialis TaxID=106654 RepID=UPI001269D341|nr:ESPR-type extended signal peptide-containing protein [Acinetobacter nosocomialis]
MNKIYKVVWNASIGTWTVVSELAKSKTRTGSVSSSSEITSSQNEIISREKKFRPKALVLSIISCLAASHVWADYTNLYGSIIDTSPTISNGIAIGANTGTPATANDSNGLAVGSRANASAADSTALGNYVNATGVNSTVVGGQASAAGAQSIALQNNSDADLVAEGLATGSSFTAVDSASSYSVAIGAMSQVVGSTAAMAIGKNAQVNSGANNATAIGNTATVDTNAVDGVAIGTNSLTSAANSVSLGPRSTASVTNSVALGAGSTTTVQSGNSYITNVAASTTNGVVSVGSATNTRRIQNVADGAADSDAVTVAQLKDVNNRAVGNTTALGGGAAYNPATDVYTAPSYTITKTDGTTYTPVNTVSGALTNLNNEVVKPITFAGNTGSSANNLGTTLNITGAGSTAGTYSGNNLKTAVTGNTVNIQMADAPVFSGTVTAGNLTTGGSLNVTGASNLNGGANLNNQKITNLAAGTISSTSTDAVNGSQLNTTNQNVTTAQNTANTAVTNAAAAQNTANTAVTNAAAAQATADKGLNFSVNGGTADNVKLGETVNFANGTNTTAVYDPTTNTYKYNVNDNIALTNAGSLTVGNSKVDNSGLTITGGPSVTTAGINAGNQKITNVAAGTVSSTSTDAVNGSQLNTTNQNVTTAQNTANTAVTNAAAAQNTANTAVTNAAAAQATADKGLNFSVNGGTADNVKLGETVNFANGTNTTAVYDPATNTYKYNVNDNIALTNAGSLTVGNSKVDNNGLTITGGPSVTTAGINAANQKITNVAAGTISASSTDAVNGSQLNTTNQNVTTAQNTANTAVTNAAAAQNTANTAVTNAAAAQNTANTAVTNAAAAQNTANTAVTNAAAAQATADKGLNFSVNGGTADNVKLGETVNFADGTNTTAVYDPATNTYKYNVNDNIALTNAGSLTVGNTKVDNSGLTITGGPSVTTAGINAGNQKITNVAVGTISATSTDAVNGSQLNTTNQNVTTAQNTANTAVTNAATAQNTANTAVTNAAAAQATADKGLNFSVNGGTADNVKLGETVNFADGTNTTAVYDPATNTYKYNVNDNIALTNAGSLTVGNSKVDNSGLTITGGPSVTTAGINAGNQKITNVAAGTISATSTDAVNGSQLNTTNQNVTTAQNTANTAVTNAAAAQATADKGLNFSVNGGTADNVKLGETVNFADGTNTTAVYDPATNTYKYNVNDNIALTNAGSLTVGNSKVDNSGLTITGGPSVTTAGINAGNQKITNVAAGTISASSTDAVNGSQLNTTNQNVTTAQNTANTAVTNAATAQNTANTAVTNAAAAQATADKGLNFSVNGGTADNVKLGETVNFADGTNTTAVYDPATNTYKYNVNDNIALTNAGSLTVGNTKVDNSGLTITGGPSVTTAGINAGNQKITNVAAGTNATDAVNVSQLDALSTSSNNKTDALGNSTANNLGGGSSYDSTTGAVSSPTYTVNGNNVNNVGDAITALDKGWTLQSNGANAAAVKAGDTVDIGTVAGESNLKVTKTGNTIQYGLNRDLNIDSVTAGDSKLDSNGLSIVGGPSVTKTGIDAAGNTITNVAAGTNATDAVNKGQLDALSISSNNKTDALGNSTANNLGGGASYDSTTGAVSSPTYTVNGNNVNNVGDAITALDKGWTLQSNGTNAAAVKAGDTVDIGTVAGESNLKVSKTGNTIQYGLNRDLNIDSVTAGDSKLDTNGLTITGGPSVTKTGIDAAGNTISNVAAGTNATDAVNKGQLDALSTSSNNKTDALGNSTANNLGGGSSYDSTTGAVSSPTYVTTKTDGTTVNANNVGDALTNLNNEVIKPITFAGNSGSVDRKLGETLNITGGLTASGSNSNVKTVISGNTVDIQLADAPVFAGKLTANGLDANGEKVTNVGAGTAATDAVNKGQLDALSTSSNNKTDALGNSTANNLGGGSSYDSTTGAVSSPTYTVNGNNVNNVGDAITALDKGWTLQSNGANAAAVKAGDTVDIGTVAGESNLKVTKTGNTIQYGLNRDLNIDSVTAGDSKLDTNGLTITGGPSVTKSGIDAAGNTISNVAAGTNATDAVNKGQLDALSTSSNNKTDALGNSTANNLGGGSSYDSTTGAVSSPTYVTTKTDGTTVNANNVGDALTNLNNEVIKPITFAGNSGSVDRKLGETLNITGGLTASGSNSNVKTVISGNTVDIQLADAPVFAGKLTANGLDANGEKVTNVGAGTAATDAVNKGQLDALSTSSNNKTDALGNSTANNLGGGSSYDSTTGAVSSPTYTVNGNNVNNVGDAITALDKGWTLQSNGANAAAVKAGDTVDIGTVAGESNLKVTKTGNTIQYGLNRDLNIDSVTAGDSKLDSNGLTIAGGPSVTKTGIDAAGNTITNVAAGTNATDAVNKGQLDHVDNRVTQVTNTTASIFGGGAKANTDGSISNPTYNVAGTSANNVGDALTALDKAVTDAGTAANAGWTISANGDAATAKNIKPNGKVNFTGDDNLTVAQTSQTDNEGNIKVALNKNLKVDSVTTGTTVIDTTGVKVGDNVQLGTTGLIIAGGPSITTSGISAGNKTISNVAAGVSSTDAVNKGQLDSAISSINNNVGALANSAVQYDKNSDGSVNKDSITLAGGANGTTIKNVANGTIAEGSKDAVNGGQLWTVQQQVDKNTGDISNLQTDISNINNGKSGLVQQANKDAAITVGKDTGGTQVNVAGTAGDRTVTGVKAGAVTATSKDAVNGSQLNTTNQALVNYLGGGAGYDNITQSFSNPTYNVGDKSYNNVGDAIGALNQADQTLNTKIDNVSNKLEQAFYATNQRIDDVEKRANAGIAAAMALENAPFVAGKYTYAVGAAYHGGENAVGVTLRKTADNGRWSLTGGVAAASQGDPSVRIGISGVID